MKMKLLFCLVIIPFLITYSQDTWIRINQIGYLNNSPKTAVLLSRQKASVRNFDVCDALTGKVVYSSEKVSASGAYGPFVTTYRLDFSGIRTPGSYFIRTGGVSSPVFRIGNDVYNSTADFLLRYMRQQQCGYNPLLKDSCHTHDGFIIYNPELEGKHIDVTGGWHDASDYLQYVTTSANAVYQMLFAYQQNPQSFGDQYDKDGNAGPNGIPDILDQAKWGLDWLVKMNPKAEMMFNQIADDRDHAGFKLPTLDTISYGGRGLERPVYFIDGKPQGLFKYKNRTTGVASTAGKYASAFALGSVMLKKYYPDFSGMIAKKAVEAYKFGKKYPGICQTAPCKSPYFYEEDNYADDMELAAAQLYINTGNRSYLKDAAEFGKREPVTPWMGEDTASHYQWYPFINLGHYYLSTVKDKKISSEFIQYLRKGIQGVYDKGRNNPFQIGIPFIWCSNNLVAAMLTQISLYTKLTGDESYQQMEASLRDWLFGCNPWGTSMIIGMPEGGDYPEDPHSAFSAVHNIKIDGGLVDGPVYSTIYGKLYGLHLAHPDEYEQVQPSRIVYHDDYGDYSTNEPTMDGTASLTYYLGAMQASGNHQGENYEKTYGAITRGDRNKKMIHLVFSGHEYADGANKIISTLKKHGVKASFFFTGDFYRNEKYAPVIYELKSQGHYLGAHSDKHLLYSDWGRRDSTLVSKEQFLTDLKNNYLEMEKFGINKSDAPYYLPPYEWYNSTIAEWAGQAGLQLINFTDGIYSNADWTIPEPGEKYYSSDEIYKRIMKYESSNKYGLNGAIMLMHIGTDPKRTDKFYDRLDLLLSELEKKGYTFGLLK